MADGQQSPYSKISMSHSESVRVILTLCSSPQQPEAEEEEEESDSSHDDSDEGDTRRDEEEEKVTFDERTLTSLPEKTEEGGGEMRGSFTGFSFKKRTTGRPQIRQRTSELS